MIAFAAAHRYDGHDSPLDIDVRARWELASLPPHPVQP
jgi:probable O-sialoglycoprotein endopeptidase